MDGRTSSDDAAPESDSTVVEATTGDTAGDPVTAEGADN